MTNEPTRKPTIADRVTDLETRIDAAIDASTDLVASVDELLRLLKEANERHADLDAWVTSFHPRPRQSCAHCGKKSYRRQNRCDNCGQPYDGVTS